MAQGNPSTEVSPKNDSSGASSFPHEHSEVVKKLSKEDLTAVELCADAMVKAIRESDITTLQKGEPENAIGKEARTSPGTLMSTLENEIASDPNKLSFARAYTQPPRQR